MENKTLLRPLAETAKKELVEYEDFIGRRDFINQTGIYITPDYFGLVYDSFKESGVSVAEFVESYEEKYVGSCIVEEELKGTLKYEVMDECICGMFDYDPLHYPNAWEIIDCLARELSFETQRKEEIIEQYRKVLEDAMNANKRLMELLSPNNSLKE